MNGLVRLNTEIHRFRTFLDKKCSFFLFCIKLCAASLSDTPRSSSWWRWKTMVKLLMFKKNPDEKYFFIMEKLCFDFFQLKKKIGEKKTKKIMFFLSLKKLFFSSKHRFFSKKKEEFLIFSKIAIFSKSDFSMMNRYFSSGFFLAARAGSQLSNATN